MDPLAPATVTLAPAVAHIAEEAIGLASELGASDVSTKSEAEVKRDKQQALVKRAVHGPETLTSLLNQNKRAAAREEWLVILAILERCGSAKGCQELKSKCEKIMEEENSAHEHD